MLVIPALLSLKQTVIEKPTTEIVELIATVIRKLKDPEEIVAKTAKKLVLELQKCYPNHFESHIVPQLKSETDKQICKAVIRQDENEINKILYGQQPMHQIHGIDAPKSYQNQ